MTGFRLEIYSWLDLFRRRYWHRTVGCGVLFFQQLSGINAFIYYAPTLFQNLGQTPHTALIMSGIFNIIKVVAVIVCFFIIDHVGRRRLAIFGAVGNALYYIIIAVLSGLLSSNWPAHGDAGWATAAMSLLLHLSLWGIVRTPWMGATARGHLSIGLEE